MSILNIFCKSYSLTLIHISNYNRYTKLNRCQQHHKHINIKIKNLNLVIQ
ncbi:hypothetical protein BCAH1134_C0529 (plasmid) [Bacillus cereus AH1134]|nr:hypothetical protein BCAH1134_C0529 [Bacillus cereus AH1134]